jgi:large subunit ribosomal protein L23
MKAAQDIILTPVITERSVDDMAESKYTFKVAKDANKVEIAKAAEELFQVQVLKVNTVNCTGHTKRMGRSVGKCPDFKKAVITINPEPTADTARSARVPSNSSTVCSKLQIINRL